jgi:hypothetical protein
VAPHIVAGSTGTTTPWTGGASGWCCTRCCMGPRRSRAEAGGRHSTAPPKLPGERTRLRGLITQLFITNLVWLSLRRTLCCHRKSTKLCRQKVLRCIKKDQIKPGCEVVDTTRNTTIGCALSEAVLCESHLKHYQQRFILSCSFQLLGVGLSVAVLHVEPLLIIL